MGFAVSQYASVGVSIVPVPTSNLGLIFGIIGGVLALLAIAGGIYYYKTKSTKTGNGSLSESITASA